MSKGGATYWSFTAFALLSAVPSTAGTSIWHVNIDESPAPPPQDGPPFSAHATRNKALLPFQVIGIVGSYFAAIIILGTLFIAVGRTSRRRAMEAVTKPTEMVKPAAKIYDPSPVSPASSRNWYSPRKIKPKKSVGGSIHSEGGDMISPATASVVSFDSNVIEADRQRRQEEMERLYAAVMEQDEQKPQKGVAVTTTEVPILAQPKPPQYYQHQEQRGPPSLVTDAPALRQLKPQSTEWSPRSPGTPKSPVRAIYPPESPLPPMPTSPTGRIRVGDPKTSMTAQNFVHPPSGDPQLGRPSRTPSFGSSKTMHSGTTAVSTSSGNKLRKSLRHLKISAPLHRDDNSDGARTPLSPRCYMDPGIPPEPPSSMTTESQWPVTPRTAKTWNPEEGEELDVARPLPHPYPSRHSVQQYGNQAQAGSLGTATETRQLATAARGNRPLPLRQMAMQYSQEQRDAYAGDHPLSPLTWNQGYPVSAGPVKTTFLEPRRDWLAGPRTGLATPYSPYMPFTPVTPVTPHLTTRAERKQRAKEERKVHGAITEEDAVADDKDLWASGY